MPLLGTAIAPYEPLATRLDPKAVARLVAPEGAGQTPPAAAGVTAAAGGASDTATLAAAAAVEGNLISIDDFLRVDLRVAKVLNADLTLVPQNTIPITDDGDAWLDTGCAAVLRHLAEHGAASAKELRAALPELAGSYDYAPGKRWGGETPLAPRLLTVLSVRG